MKLVGMLDSPYVRRVAISLQLLGLRFEHQSLSVFRGFDEFQRINPVVKACGALSSRCGPHSQARWIRPTRSQPRT